MVKADIYPITAANMGMFEAGEYEFSMRSNVIGHDEIDAVAFCIDSEVVAFGGVRKFPWSMCEGFFSAKAETPPFVFVQARIVWKQLTEGIRRAQAEVDIRNPDHINFAYSLGLIPEGVMRRAGPAGEDFIMFVRIL